MEKRICKDCGEPFKIPQNEARFYESKNMSLPARCKECRDKRKKDGAKGTGYKGRSERDNQILIYLYGMIFLVVILVKVFGFLF